jgi:hypothetical protein
MDLLLSAIEHLLDAEFIGTATKKHSPKHILSFHRDLSALA